MEIETATLANYTCSDVWSPSVHRYTYIFFYSSPCISYNYSISGSMHTCTKIYL